ncbi:MAG: Crp/Fnr family transcriptional regulator [Woeseiaceae bacterium]
MRDPSVAAVLQNNVLFSDLSSDTLEAVAASAVHRTYGAGEIIFSQGDKGDALYAVASGNVRISALDSSGHEMFLNIMDPGDTFGELSLIDGLQRTAGATAVLPSKLVVIPREAFLAQLTHDSELTMHLLNLLCVRLRLTIDLVEASVFLSGPARVAKRLTSLITLHGRQRSSGEIELRLSQADLAHFLGVSRQIVNGYLQSWHKVGWVDLGRGRIIVNDLAALQGIARGGAIEGRSEETRSADAQAR